MGKVIFRGSQDGEHLWTVVVRETSNHKLTTEDSEHKLFHSQGRNGEILNAKSAKFWSRKVKIICLRGSLNRNQQAQDCSNTNTNCKQFTHRKDNEGKLWSHLLIGQYQEPAPVLDGSVQGVEGPNYPPNPRGEDIWNIAAYTQWSNVWWCYWNWKLFKFASKSSDTTYEIQADSSIELVSSRELVPLSYILDKSFASWCEVIWTSLELL